MRWNGPDQLHKELQNRILIQEEELEHLRLKSHIYSFLSVILSIALAIALLLRVG